MNHLLSLTNTKFDCASDEDPQQLNTITKSDSYNWHRSIYHGKDYTPDKSHDGNLDTWYSVKDFSVAGNFLKLYLAQIWSIASVEITSRSDLDLYVERMKNTEVFVYLTAGGETEVSSCGIVPGKAISAICLHKMASITFSTVYTSFWPDIPAA